MSNIFVLLMFINVIISAFSQILLKKGALFNSNSFLSNFLNKYVIIGYTIYVGVIILNSYYYKFVDLKIGSIIESSGIVFVLFFSSIFLKEDISKNKKIGCLIILLGSLIFILN